METRWDLNEFDKAVEYVNSIGWAFRLSWPEWFRYDKEFTDQDLEDELEHLEDHEVEGLDNYDSFIEKLRSSVRGHTSSFMDDEEAKLTTMFESEQTREPEPEDEQSEGVANSPVSLDFQRDVTKTWPVKEGKGWNTMYMSMREEMRWSVHIFVDDDDENQLNISF